MNSFYKKRKDATGAIVYCEGAFNTLNGKTTHGLVRFTRRYRVLSVVDSRYAGKDAGEVLDGKPTGIPIHASLSAAVEAANAAGTLAELLVVGLAPDGGRLSPDARKDVMQAIRLGLNIHSGLHDFLSEDTEIRELARKYDVTLHDIRKPPPRNSLHFFSGKIEEVTALKIAVLGTDSAVGKRTTAWLLVHALLAAGHSVRMVGTGQTAWMQGADRCLLLDSLVNDFVAGEIEHAVWSAWKEDKSAIIVIEGQGSLMNPAYPGGFEILAAGRPDIVLLQHAPMRKDYDGFPGYPIQPLHQQIEVAEILSGKPVAAVVINHEDMESGAIPVMCDAISNVTGLPCYDVLTGGAAGLVEIVEQYINKEKGK